MNQSPRTAQVTLGTIFVVVSLVLTSSQARSQSARPIEFGAGRPSLIVAEPFSEVAAVAELADGRLVVADSKDREFRLVSRDGGTVEQLGRNGGGPLEYAGAWGIVRLPGDTLGLYGGNRRYLILSPSGTLVRDLMIPEAFLSRGGVAAANGADSAGAIYWDGDILTLTSTGLKRSAFLNVRRWQPGSERLDSVARVADHASAMDEHRFFPFAERDAWVVAPDGRIGVVRAADYRLRWFRDGRLVGEGPSLMGTTRIPVEAGDRVAYRLRMAQLPTAQASFVAPEGERARPTSAELRRTEEAYPDRIFPPFKPPVVEDGALLSPGGDIWVILSQPLTATEQVVDVLNPQGERRLSLRLAPGRRVVALQRGGVYLARIDEDGLQWLERYAWPAGLR